MEIKELAELLRQCWSKETSYDPTGWTKSNPAWGQCAVTAFIVTDYFGGDLIAAGAILPNGARTPHYFNRIEGNIVDLTQEQFPEGTVISDIQVAVEGFCVERDRDFFAASTHERYKLLKSKLETLLKNQKKE